jgi:hypothetical protein
MQTNEEKTTHAIRSSSVGCVLLLTIAATGMATEEPAKPLAARHRAGP